MKTITLDKHPSGRVFIADVNPTLNSRIKKVQSFDSFEKVRIYMHYYITQLGLKHNFEVVDATKENSKNGWSKPDKTFNQIACYYPWKDINIKTIDEFYSEENIEIRDCGENWRECGFAQRWWFECSGVYDWYWKFECEFKN
jgi:hypothetical protein